MKCLRPGPQTRPMAGPAGTAAVALVLAALAACQPTVKVEAPDKPIVVNLNIKIEQEVRVKVERDAEQLIDARPDIF